MRSPHAYSPRTGALSQLTWGASVPAVLVNTQHEHAHKNCPPPHTHMGRLAAAAIPPCCFRAFAAKRTESVRSPPALQAASPKPHFLQPVYSPASSYGAPRLRSKTVPACSGAFTGFKSRAPGEPQPPVHATMLSRSSCRRARLKGTWTHTPPVTSRPQPQVCGSAPRLRLKTMPACAGAEFLALRAVPDSRSSRPMLLPRLLGSLSTRCPCPFSCSSRDAGDLR